MRRIIRPILFLTLLSFAACDPEEDPVVIDNGLVGLWQGASLESDLQYISVDLNGDETVSYRRNRAVNPSDFTMRFALDPQVITTSGSTNFESTTTFADGSTSVQIIPGQQEINGTTWEKEGQTLIVTKDSGESQRSEIVSLTDRELILHTIIGDTIFAGFYLEGEQTHRYTRK